MHPHRRARVYSKGKGKKEHREEGRDTGKWIGKKKREESKGETRVASYAATAAARAARTALRHGVDLVDEDDARGVLLGLGEDVPHPGSAHSHEHLDELGPRRVGVEYC